MKTPMMLWKLMTMMATGHWEVVARPPYLDHHKLYTDDGKHFVLQGDVDLKYESFNNDDDLKSFASLAASPNRMLCLQTKEEGSREIFHILHTHSVPGGPGGLIGQVSCRAITWVMKYASPIKCSYGSQLIFSGLGKISIDTNYQ